jgi:RHS repeat-associated protein
MVVVPNVVGQPQASAEAAITAAGLTATIAQAYSTVVIAGNVISQNPAGGASALQGASVNLVVSLGPSGLPPDPATVAPPVDLAVATTLGSATSFLYSGTNPIQTGVAPGTISPIRAAVLRGKVLDRSNNPLPNVTIAILNHPEFGQTLSRADGMFDMAVNGGGLLTVNYAKVGLLPAQRQVKAPWQDYVMAPDVVLIPSDPQVTTVDLTADTPIQVARGSRMTDADGSRQATLLFPQGTQAQLVMPDGTTQALTTLSVRATEYTVGPYGPKAMPGELPPSSGYTYAVELSADEAIAAGATSVRFSQPVPFYVENFVGFPVGSLVPTGFYDRGKGQWVASDNGRVIKVISITGGLADLDLDGNGTADDAAALAALGITDAERQRLAALYTPGQSMWRVLIPHFTPWDCNWPYGPPPGSGGPGGGDDKPKPGPKPDKRPNNPCKKGGSIIGCEPQTLGEVIKVTGTPLSLHYQSDRVPGRRDTNILKIRLSGATLPPGLQRIHLEIAIAGRAIKQNFAPQANLVETFTWDGKDAYGRPVQGQQPATVRIGYEYIAQYYATSDSFEASFNRFGSPPIAVARGGGGGGGGGAVVFSRPLARTTTPPIILWQDYKASLGGFDSLDLGGWSLSVHHTYDVGGRTLYLGNGDQRSAEAMGVTITTVAGTGVNGFAGDGGPATQARLNSPMGVAMGPDGSLYIADTADHRIRRVGPNGIITTVAGTNYGAFAGDGGLATQAWLYNPHGVALGPDGSLYIADTDNHRIRRVGPNGIISTVAGTGVADYSGDGGPATLAGLSYPRGVAVGSDGSLYIASTILSNNQRVRRVGPDGIISTVAGTGGYGFAGDGGLATQALVWPWGVAVGSDGSLYIADYYNHRIRRVGPDGIITTVAGTGVADITGDGGPATQAKLAYPRGVAVGSDGSLYIADYYNNRIRRVGPDGIITTVAGKGAVYYGSFSGDGGLAMQANLYSPQGVAVGPDGSLYVADTFNHRIRQLSPPLPGTTLSDIFIAAEDGSEVYVFNSTGRHLRTLEALTSAVRFQFTYDSANRLATITDSDGNVTTIERDGSGNPSAIVAPFGQRTTLAVDANGYLSHVTNPAGEAVQLTYNSGNAEGLLATLTDPRGNVHRYFYDALGRLIRDENPAGGVTTLARTDITDGHYAVTLTTALGLVTTYEVEELSTGDTRRVRIDPSGARTESLIRTDGSRLITYPDGTVANLVEGPDPRFGMQAPILKTLTVNRPGGTTTTRTATRTATLLVPNNLLSLTAQTETVTINGKTYTSTYSAATKKVTTTTPSGRQSVTTIDAEGRLVQAAVAGIAPVQLAYDGRGRLASLTQDDRTYTLTYDSQGYLSLLTDPLTHSVGFTRDTAGRPTLQTRPDGEQIGLTYDANGNLASLTPPGRPSHEFSYTPIDLLQIYTPPDLGFTPKDTQYVYNPDRQLIQLLQPNVSASLSYDVAGRVQSLVYPQDTVSYGYDSASRLQTIVTSSGINLTYGYDGNLPTDTTWSGPVTGTVHRTYDNNFRTTTRTINGANALSFAYDADGLLVQAGALTLQRNAQNGLLTGTTLGVVNDTLSYNSFGELVNYTANVSATPALSTQFTRDKLGRITQKVETVGGVVHTYDYGYDLAGRLEQVKQDDLVTASYTYDSNGNRLTGPGVLNTATYDDQDRLLSYNGSTYDYTANGALKTKTTGPFITSYDYDVLGNLKHVTLPGGATIDYVIDGQNRRIGKKVGGTLVQGFLYQDDLKPIVELDGTNTVVSRFVYGAGINVPDYMVKGGVTYRIITDHLGGPRVVVNTTDGTIIQRMDYDEFGRVILDTNPGFQPFGFAGGLYDRDTRLVRFGARDYDAETGRWTAKDPMRFRGGQANLYSYVQSDPLNHTDASGLSDGMSGPGGVCISGKDPNDGGMSPAGAGPELVRDGSWYYDPITDTWMLDFSRPSGWLAQKGFGWALGKALGLGFAGARLIGMVLNLEDDMGGRSPGARENKNGNCQCE